MNEVEELKKQLKLFEDMYKKDMEEITQDRDMWKDRALAAEAKQARDNRKQKQQMRHV